MFVSAVIAEGKAAFRHALESGVTLEHLSGAGAEVFAFVCAYTKEYGDLPTVDIVAGKTGIELPPVEGKAAFFTAEVLNRKLHIELMPKVRDWAELLEQAKPREMVADAETTLRRIRQDFRTARVESLTRMGEEVWEDYQRMKKGQWGIEIPWPTINEATLGMWPEDLILFVARVGVGKCLAASTPVLDPVTGLMTTIQHRVETPGAAGSAVTFDRSAGLVVRPVGQVHDNGTKACVRLRVSSGRELTLTPNHPLLTAEGWREAGSLKPGQTIALPARMPFPAEPVSLPLWEVRLLAILLAEGSYTGNHTGFSTTDPEILRMGREAADALGVDLVPVGPCGYDFRRRESSGPNAVRALLRRHGIDDTLAKHKRIPDAIYRLPPEQLGEFLGVFWMCDGYVESTGPGMTLASQEMLEQIQHLMLRFGVQTRVEYKRATCDGKDFDAWRLRVYAAGQERMLRGLHLWGEKRERVVVLAAKNKNPNRGFPRVSDAFVERVKQIADTKQGRWNGGGMAQVRDRLGWKTRSFGVRDLFGANQTLMLGRFREFCDVHGCTDEFAWLWDEGLFWDEVESVTDAGEHRVYDLGMAPTHNFVANDVVVHNSWTGLMLAQHAWAKGKRVLFVTTEMARLNIARRFVALHLRLPFKQFRRGQLGEFVEKKVEAELKALAEKDGFYIIGGDFNFTFEDLETSIDEAEPDLLIVDGAYLMKAQGVSRTERAAAAFDELKRVGKRHKIAVAATSQFNREVKNNAADTISLERIALTDTASWNADVVIAVIRTEDMRRDNKAEMRVLKNREGVTGEPVGMWWNFDEMRFDELPKTGGGDADEFGTGLPITGLPSEPGKPDPFEF
jgi:intein/homing endonuclease